MKKKFNFLGIIIAASSFFSFINPDTWFYHLPVIVALGCIVYAMGDILEGIARMQK